VPAKRFHILAAEIQPLATGYGGCIASDRITVDGVRVGFMYREAPQNQLDSGWAFAAGDETPEYMDDADKHAIYDVNTIANYDRDIITLLGAPTGSAFERDDETGAFVAVHDFQARE
jgi:hypothetical protein